MGPFLSRLCCPRSPRVSSPTANPGDTDGLVSGSPGESGGSLTASAFKSYTRKVYHSTSFKRPLWVVPKNNQFTAEPAYILDPGTLAELPAWFDYDKYMIVDQAVPKHQLGPNVMELKRRCFGYPKRGVAD